MDRFRIVGLVSSLPVMRERSFEVYLELCGQTLVTGGMSRAAPHIFDAHHPSTAGLIPG